MERITSAQYKTLVNTPLTGDKARNKNIEDYLQIMVVNYIEHYIQPKYPSMRMIVNPFSSLKMPAYLMARMKKLGFKRGQPDIMITYNNGRNYGLAIELKKLGEKVFRKDGSLRKSQHLERQSNYLYDLERNGWVAEFAIGFDEARNLIDRYFSTKLNN